MCAEINSSSLKWFLLGLGLQWWEKLTNVDTKHPICLAPDIWLHQVTWRYSLHPLFSRLYPVNDSSSGKVHSPPPERTRIHVDMGKRIWESCSACSLTVLVVLCYRCLVLFLSEFLSCLHPNWGHLAGHNCILTSSIFPEPGTSAQVNTQQRFPWVCRDLGKWKER